MNEVFFTTQLIETAVVPDVPTLQQHILKQLNKEVPHLKLEPSHLRLQFLNEPTENLTIELVRSLITQLSYAYRQQLPQIFVLFNVETASTAAQNALLKKLEEPPANTCLVLITTNSSNILPTIKSRCKSSKITQAKVGVVSDPYAAARENTNLATLSVRAVLEKIDTLSDRDEALTWCRTLLAQAVQEYQAKPTVPATTQLRAITAAISDLQANLHSKLALEHHFLPVCFRAGTK
jgi:hypothetical protein